MIKEFINLYNNLVNLSRNKSLFSIFTDKDTFSDRILMLLFHFAFFLRQYKGKTNKEYLQNFFDYFFRQIELSIREIGYGDVSINKKMKDYINLLHSIISEIHFWNDMEVGRKRECISNFLQNFKNTDFLVDYFDDFSKDLKKFNLKSYLKSVNTL